MGQCKEEINKRESVCVRESERVWVGEGTICMHVCVSGEGPNCLLCMDGDGL